MSSRRHAGLVLRYAFSGRCVERSAMLQDTRPSNLGSSQYPVYEPGKPVKGEWKKTTVPRINLEATWRKHFGDLRCHLLKVNIEGSEGSLLKAETEFLRRVDVLVLEWHKWIVRAKASKKACVFRGSLWSKSCRKMRRPASPGILVSASA